MFVVSWLHHFFAMVLATGAILGRVTDGETSTTLFRESPSECFLFGNHVKSTLRI